MFLQQGLLFFDDIKCISADRENGIDNINYYLGDNPFAATNACIIADSKNCILHACRGLSNKGELRELIFD